MKRNLLVGGAVIAVIAAIAFVKCSGGGDTPKTATTASSSHTTTAIHQDKRIDPRTLKRASLSGTVTDAVTKAPIAGAQVCGDGQAFGLSAQAMREPACTTTNGQGVYTLGDLVAASYRVGATAPSYRPTAFRLATDRDASEIDLKPGEARTGIDIALRTGGVEITGTVSDVTGGPIAQAQVRASSAWTDLSPPTETDANGTFKMWVNPGPVMLRASAEGYTSSGDWGRAPGAFDITLTPESSLAGTVIDATTKQPVAGVRVWLASDDSGWDSDDEPSDITNDDGSFRIGKLAPGRYRQHASSPHGIGYGDGTTLVGLGQHVTGVIVRLHAGAHLTGTVRKPDKMACRDASVGLTDRTKDLFANTHTDADGQVHADGVLPGTYEVEVHCEGMIARESYPPITVTDKDIAGLVWDVDGGATVRGKILTKRGEPVPDAWVSAQPKNIANDARMNGGGARTNADGTFSIDGLMVGTYSVTLNSSKGHAPPDGWPLEIANAAAIEKNFTVDDGGKLAGTVVDSNGKPVSNVTVSARSSTRRSSTARTNGDGTFVIESLLPGDYLVIALRSSGGVLRKPGTTDDAKQGEPVTIVVNRSTTVKLVVEPQTGQIRGSVAGVDGAPVPDAYVTAARESDAAGAPPSSVFSTRWGDRKPTITQTDGTFTIGELSPGVYTIRAYIRGGGEAIAEHVTLGSTTRLQLRPTGSITGTATLGGVAAQDLSLELRDPKTGFWRQESYFRTNGTFALKDLPAGTYTLTVTAAAGQKQLQVTLADGEAKTVTLVLEALVTITGRVIDYVTKQPVAGIEMAVDLKDSGFSARKPASDKRNVSGSDGRFVIEGVPGGAIRLVGWPQDYENSGYAGVMIGKQITGTGTIDVGDVAAHKLRIKRGDKLGELGIDFAQPPLDTPIEKREWKVSHVDPKGPAVSSGIKVGDVVISIDGISIVGDGALTAWTLMQAPPGTKLTLGLQGGTSVSIVLAPPT